MQPDTNIWGKALTREVEQLLDTFDHLPEAQQREAASEILRRVQRLTL